MIRLNDQLTQCKCSPRDSRFHGQYVSLVFPLWQLLATTIVMRTIDSLYDVDVSFNAGSPLQIPVITIEAPTGDGGLSVPIKGKPEFGHRDT